MYNILCNIPILEDATSWYRAIGPISHLRKTHRNLAFHISSMYNWSYVQPADVLFMQRPHTPEQVTVMEMAKRAKVPIWIDYDDYLLGVPTDNPTFFQYQDEANMKSVITLLQNADVVTVSTNHLKNLYSQFNKNIHVIENAINEKLFPRPEQMPEPQKHCIWRGSRTHQRDVMNFAKEIIEIQNNNAYADWIFIYLGDNLWFLTDHTPHQRTVVSKPLHIDEFNIELLNLKPSLFQVPLVDTQFNKAKSNIAWIEATYAGAVTLCPNWEEWVQPGTLNYNNPAEYKLMMEMVFTNQVDIKKQNHMSWEAIMSRYTLEKTNQKRAQMLADLLGISQTKLLGS